MSGVPSSSFELQDVKAAMPAMAKMTNKYILVKFLIFCNGFKWMFKKTDTQRVAVRQSSLEIQSTMENQYPGFCAIPKSSPFRPVGIG